MGRDDCKTVVAAHPPLWTSLISNMTARILRAGLRAPSLIRPMRNAKRRSLVPNSSTTPDATPPALGFEVALEPSRLGNARERLRDYLHRHCADEGLVANVVLCLEEACTNVIRHSGAREAMQVALRFDHDALVCTVRDHGHGFDIESFDPRTVPDPLANDGRGLFIIAHIMDELSLRLDGGLEVEMVKRAVPRCAAHAATAGPVKQDSTGTRESRPDQTRRLEAGRATPT